MPPTVSAMFGELLNAFIFTLSGGLARSQPEVMAFLLTMATIELTVSALVWAFYRQNWMAALFWKMLGFSFLAWIIDSWPQLAKWLLDGFIEAGLLVGGSVLSVNDITDPGNIVDFGFSVTALLMGKLAKLSLWNYGFEIIFGGLAGWLVVLCYIVVAVHVFKALLEYYIASACLIFLVPFLAHEKTAPFGERVFGTFMAHAVRLMVYAVILSIMLPILHTYKLGLDPKFTDAWMLFSAAFLFFVIALGAPAMAHGLMMGTPVLSMSNMLFGASSAMQTAGAVGAVGAAASIAGAAAMRGAVSAGSAIRTAAQLGAAQYGAAHPGSSGISSSVVGGAQGMGQYATHALTSGFRAALHQGRTRAAAAFPAPPQP